MFWLVFAVVLPRRQHFLNGPTFQVPRLSGQGVALIPGKWGSHSVCRRFKVGAFNLGSYLFLPLEVWPFFGIWYL